MIWLHYPHDIKELSEAIRHSTHQGDDMNLNDATSQTSQIDLESSTDTATEMDWQDRLIVNACMLALAMVILLGVL